jgi:hypothetical protein
MRNEAAKVAGCSRDKPPRAPSSLTKRVTDRVSAVV